MSLNDLGLGTRYACCDQRRLEVQRRSGSLNGIEWLEVRDRAEPQAALRQRTLFLRLIRPLGAALLPAQVRIDGGERIASVAVQWVARGDALPPGVPASLVAGFQDLARLLVVRTEARGDFSRYRLLLADAPLSDAPHPGFDPRLAAIDFSFKVECPSDADCAEPVTCPEPLAPGPQIDYLAKDYPGFRRLMLERLSLLAPGWQERSAADLGIALVELLAYAADNLSYRQDALATEAYLSTARNRISLRRHARLVDYAVHEGCNARAWVHFEVAADVALPRGTPLLTRAPSLPVALVPGSPEAREALARGAQTFETAAAATLRAAHNHLALYTWGDAGCCLPRGSTRATLRGRFPQLRPGDVLVLAELLSPTTLQPQDADLAHRWAVRLVAVDPDVVDPCGQLFDEPPVDAPLQLTAIEWSAADALPFALCVGVERAPRRAVSAAFGNIVLADHGRTVRAEALPAVPAPRLQRVPADAATACDSCVPAERPPVPVRFQPVLVQRPVTMGFDLAADLAVPVADEARWHAASALIERDAREALPAGCELHDALWPATPRWTPRRDLLASTADDTHFVVECEADGLARLRFGDDRHGRRPEPQTAFSVQYRVGNGRAGNVGADAIAHVVVAMAGIFTTVRNFLPAAGGTEPEDAESVRRDAPEAFRSQERAVTAADHAEVAERRAEVQRAAATFRWTGSWHTAFVAADRRGGAPVDAPFSARLLRHMERYRMAGLDLAVRPPCFVPVVVALHVCVLEGHFRSAVLRAVREVLGNGTLADGRPALFHPDRFSFGEPVLLSPIVAAVQAVAGVQAVWPLRFERQSGAAADSLARGVIEIGPLEVAQLDLNPNTRERGRLVLEIGGGL